MKLTLDQSVFIMLLIQSSKKVLRSFFSASLLNIFLNSQNKFSTIKIALGILLSTAYISFMDLNKFKYISFIFHSAQLIMLVLNNCQFLTNTIMNKTTNNFRKCDYCPHHQPKACCCRRDMSTFTGKRANKTKTSKQKSKKNQTINQSTISYANTSFPMNTFPNVMAENSVLRSQNDYLKRELQSQFQHVSMFTGKEDINMTTLPTSQNQSTRNSLHEKLYLSNKNLQDTLMEMDSLSKVNSHLHETNKKLEIEVQQLKIKQEEDYEQIKKLKKKNRKCQEMIDNFPNEKDLQSIIQLNTRLQNDNHLLQEEVAELQEKMRNAKTHRQYDNLSPEWVAHTSTKINAIEKNITKLQIENNSKPENLFRDNSELETENIKTLKTQLAFAVQQIHIQSKSLNHLENFELLFSQNQSSLLNLIKNLCQGVLQATLQNHLFLEKQLQRKLSTYENKINKLQHKIQNLLIKVHNDRLRSRSLTRRGL